MRRAGEAVVGAQSPCACMNIHMKKELLAQPYIAIVHCITKNIFLRFFLSIKSKFGIKILYSYEPLELFCRIIM